MGDDRDETWEVMISVTGDLIQGGGEVLQKS